MLSHAHLAGPTLGLLRREVVLSVLVCWVPLAVLSLAQAHFLGGAKLSFFRDIETHVRFLVSLPVLILAEMLVHERTPLFLFTPQLARARREGFAEYGALASTYVMDFDQKWLRSKVNDEQLLGSGDIQSLADLGNSFAVVREMRAVPFVTDDVVRLLIVTVVPLVPLLLTIMPLDQLVTQAIKIIF
jgi:hypothetical protein